MNRRNNIKPLRDTVGNNHISSLSTDELRRLYIQLRADRMELVKENERLRRQCRALESTGCLLKEIFDSAPFGYVSLDEAGTVVSVNLTLASLLDSERQAIIGNDLTGYIAENHRKIFYNSRRALLDTNERQSCDVALIRSDASEVYVRMALRLVEVPETAGREIRVTATELPDPTDGSVLDASHDKFMRLYRHVQSLREEEKYKFSRAIHDELSQVLAVLKMELSWLEEHFDPANAGVHSQFENLKKLLDHTIRASKQITSELRPYMLDELGLYSAVKWAAKQFTNRSGIETELAIETGSTQIDKSRATALFRILQELLANAEQHANASRVRLNLYSGDGGLTLDVRDNGCGINRSRIINGDTFGLMETRQRAYEFGGDIAISGDPAAGTHVKVWIPLKDQ